MRALSLMGVLLVGCVGSGELPARLSGRIVGVDGTPIGPGLVLIERGKVHEGSYKIGTRIDAEGRFSADLPSGGIWGIHLFRDGYQYLPMQIDIADHEQVRLTSFNVQWGVWMELSGAPTWPDQPADAHLVRMPIDDLSADNPALSNLRMSYEGELLNLQVDVYDPNGDLSRMILAHDLTTGAGYAFNPPSPPDAQGNFPNGTYSLKVFLDPRHVPGESKWDFVVSDNLCNDSDILTVTLPPR